MQLGAAIIEHRLSLLSPAAEEILLAAAVIGAEVDFDLLACICAPRETTSRVVDSDLHSPVTDDLLRLGFLVETDTGYCFSHEQVRRAVYRRLSPEQRQRLHRRVAQALESLFPEQFELLAQHYIAAGEREPAIHYLKRAAECSRELFAHQTTLATYDRLLSLLTHAEGREARYDILRNRAEVLGWVGDRDAQGRDLEEMLDLAGALSDKVRRAQALHARSEWHRLQGQYKPANEDARAALGIYRQLGDDREQAALLCQLGWNIVYTSAASQAAEYFREALPICKSMGDLRSQLSCLSGLAAAAKMTGDYAGMLSYLQEHIALAETSGDPSRIGRALSNAGVIYYTLGDIEVAMAFLQRALKFKETAGDRRSTAFTLVYMGLMDAEHGEFKTAQAHLTTALETFREVQDAAWEGETLGMLGRLALWRGDPAAAGELLQAAYQHYRDIGELAGTVGVLSYLALAELVLGDEAAAWQHSQVAVDELEGSSLEVEHSQEIYYNHFCVAGGAHCWAAARAALEKAACILEEQSGRINDPVLQEKYRTGRRFNRDIAEALAGQPPLGQLRVCLARADASPHRQPASDELLTVIWTVDAGEEDADLSKREGKVALRRHRLLRLLAEAEAAGGLPTVADLAGGLDFSPRTIRADLAVLRRQGHAVRTRGIQA
jgi:tetratricopeptide (TPR) repeat protein